jgi:hypothetical protein
VPHDSVLVAVGDCTLGAIRLRQAVEVARAVVPLVAVRESGVWRLLADSDLAGQSVRGASLASLDLQWFGVVGAGRVGGLGYEQGLKLALIELLDRLGIPSSLPAEAAPAMYFVALPDLASPQVGAVRRAAAQVASSARFVSTRDWFVASDFANTAVVGLTLRGGFLMSGGSMEIPEIIAPAPGDASAGPVRGETDRRLMLLGAAMGTDALPRRGGHLFSASMFRDFASQEVVLVGEAAHDALIAGLEPSGDGVDLTAYDGLVGLCRLAARRVFLSASDRDRLAARSGAVLGLEIGGRVAEAGDLLGDDLSSDVGAARSQVAIPREAPNRWPRDHGDATRRPLVAEVLGSTPQGTRKLRLLVASAVAAIALLAVVALGVQRGASRSKSALERALASEPSCKRTGGHRFVCAEPSDVETEVFVGPNVGFPVSGEPAFAGSVPRGQVSVDFALYAKASPPTGVVRTSGGGDDSSVWIARNADPNLLALWIVDRARALAGSSNEAAQEAVDSAGPGRPLTVEEHKIISTFALYLRPRRGTCVPGSDSSAGDVAAWLCESDSGMRVSIHDRGAPFDLDAALSQRASAGAAMVAGSRSLLLGQNAGSTEVAAVSTSSGPELLACHYSADGTPSRYLVAVRGEPQSSVDQMVAFLTANRLTDLLGA